MTVRFPGEVLKCALLDVKIDVAPAQFAGDKSIIVNQAETGRGENALEIRGVHGCRRKPGKPDNVAMPPGQIAEMSRLKTRFQLLPVKQVSPFFNADALMKSEQVVDGIGI